MYRHLYSFTIKLSTRKKLDWCRQFVPRGKENKTNWSKEITNNVPLSPKPIIAIWYLKNLIILGLFASTVMEKSLKSECPKCRWSFKAWKWFKSMVYNNISGDWHSWVTFMVLKRISWMYNFTSKSICFLQCWGEQLTFGEQHTKVF